MSGFSSQDQVVPVAPASPAAPVSPDVVPVYKAEKVPLDAPAQARLLVGLTELRDVIEALPSALAVGDEDGWDEYLVIVKGDRQVRLTIEMQSSLDDDEDCVAQTACPVHDR
jgi:hypothetical protein